MDYEDLARRIDAAGLERRACVTEVRLRTFEQRHQLKLPPGYRRFLAELSDGITSEELSILGLEEAEKIAGPIGEPFPYTNAYAKHILERLLDSAEISFSDVMGDPALRARQVGSMPAGCLVLGDLGGGEMSVLVVAGEQAGFVWRVGDFDAPETNDLYADSGDGRQLDFDAWLECWAKLSSV